MGGREDGVILVADVGQKSWEQVHEWHQCLHEAEWEIGGVSVCVCGGGRRCTLRYSCARNPQFSFHLLLMTLSFIT